ncbi:MAG: dephospho-CoA kinase [Rhodobacteraceae bacterium]|nr:MAG: dephospho-CoA kinase [Paracoccaceae bacterium]
MIVVGLTGSIGMGKSTTARMFAEEGCVVWDADAAVRRLYAAGAAGAQAVAKLAPEAVGPEGVDRAALRRLALADPDLLRSVEQAVHPLVAADRAGFIDAARAAGEAVAVCDIPLLFETGAADDFDVVVVVSAPAETQRARVLARPGMTDGAFERLLARQTPDAEKRARADCVIETGDGKEAARAQVAALVARLRARGAVR